jgi:kynurenine 3-monooxygenase
MANLDDYILARCYPMKARLIHKITYKQDISKPMTTLEEQLYGLNGEVINSVDRKMLNIKLIDKAEEKETVKFLFDQECIDIDFDNASATFQSR